MPPIHYSMCVIQSAASVGQTREGIGNLIGDLLPTKLPPVWGGGGVVEGGTGDWWTLLG